MGEHDGRRYRDGVRPVIERSWRRLTDAGVDPDHLHPRQAFDPDAALEDMRRASPLNDVADLLRGCLGRFADDAEHLMVIVDATGRILWIEGDRRVRGRADAITFREGMEWTEESAGTNAIGTALAIEHAVQIFSAEHFLAEQHPWWCSAAPIHDPATGELVGIVDLSGPMRTAHPHSLALVMAAAGMAEEALALRRAAADERLRRAFLERTAGAQAPPRSALLAPDGRVLLANPAGWLGALTEPPAGGRRCSRTAPRRTSSRSTAAAGSCAGSPPHRRARPGSRRSRWSCSATARRTRALGDGEPIALTGRAAELLAVLALHPEGLTGEQVTLHLYGEEGNPVTTRAELSRLRRRLGSCVGARPYRLRAAVRADFLEVERKLGGRRPVRRARRLPRPAAARVVAPRVVQAREELAGAVERAALAGTAASLWRWLQLEEGRDDLVAMTRFLDTVGEDDPRHPVIAARRGALERRWALPVS